MNTLLKFLAVGLSGTALNLGVFTALLALGVNRFVASPLAIEAAILSNFVLHDRWTFRWRRTCNPRRTRGMRFHLVSLGSLFVSYGSFVAFSHVFVELEPWIHQLLAIPPGTAFNFVLNSGWTFRDRGPVETSPERSDPLV